MSSTPSKQTGNKKPATPAPAGLAGSASVTPAPTAVGSASASLAGVVAEDKQQPKKSGLADGVYMSVAIPVLYFSAALFSVYLFKSGLATTYVLPYFSALGLKKAVIPWAAFFAEFVIAYIAGTLSIIAFSFMGLYDNNVCLLLPLPCSLSLSLFMTRWSLTLFFPNGFFSILAPRNSTPSPLPAASTPHTRTPTRTWSSLAPPSSLPTSRRSPSTSASRNDASSSLIIFIFFL